MLPGPFTIIETQPQPLSLTLNCPLELEETTQEFWQTKVLPLTSTDWLANALFTPISEAIAKIPTINYDADCAIP